MLSSDRLTLFYNVQWHDLLGFRLQTGSKAGSPFTGVVQRGIWRLNQSESKSGGDETEDMPKVAQ